MEFKSEYRWLLFLLIPFITLLTIHITTPLTFLLSTQQPLISYYTEIIMGNLAQSLRSYTMEEAMTVSSQMGIVGS